MFRTAEPTWLGGMQRGDAESAERDGEEKE